MNTAPAVLSATSIDGNDIRNTQGEDLGKVKDLMIDLADGSVSYAVVSYGGFLGMGDKLFAVPFEALTVDPEHHAFILDAPSPDHLAYRPGVPLIAATVVGGDVVTGDVGSGPLG